MRRSVRPISVVLIWGQLLTLTPPASATDAFKKPLFHAPFYQMQAVNPTPAWMHQSLVRLHDVFEYRRDLWGAQFETAAPAISRVLGWTVQNRQTLGVALAFFSWVMGIEIPLWLQIATLLDADSESDAERARAIKSLEEQGIANVFHPLSPELLENLRIYFSSPGMKPPIEVLNHPQGSVKIRLVTETDIFLQKGSPDFPSAITQWLSLRNVTLKVPVAVATTKQLQSLCSNLSAAREQFNEQKRERHLKREMDMESADAAAFGLTSEQTLNKPIEENPDLEIRQLAELVTMIDPVMTPDTFHKWTDQMGDLLERTENDRQVEKFVEMIEATVVNALAYVKVISGNSMGEVRNFYVHRHTGAVLRRSDSLESGIKVPASPKRNDRALARLLGQMNEADSIIDLNFEALRLLAAGDVFHPHAS